MSEEEKLHNELEENYEKIVEMLSNGNFLQLNGKAINLTELNEYINAQQEEIERLNNIINDLLKRQNEALNYISNFLSMDNRYKHGNGNDELELVRRILNKHNQELKGSDKE